MGSIFFPCPYFFSSSHRTPLTPISSTYLPLFSIVHDVKLRVRLRPLEQVSKISTSGTIPIAKGLNATDAVAVTVPTVSTSLLARYFFVDDAERRQFALSKRCLYFKLFTTSLTTTRNATLGNIFLQSGGNPINRSFFLSIFPLGY
jgi:hypothetical protein